MPRAPQILSTGEVGTASAPRLSPEGFANISTLGVRTGAKELGQAAQQYEQIYTTLRAEDEKLDAERALGEAQRQFAERDIELKQDPNLDADQYPQAVDKSLRQIREGVGKTLKYPGSRVMFERSMEHFNTTQAVKARYEGLERMHAQVRAGSDLALREDERAAVLSLTPELQEAAVQRGLTRIQNLVSTRVYSGAEGAAKTGGFLANIEEGRIHRDARDPAKLPGIMRDLIDGKVPNLPLEKQNQLAQHFVTQMRQEDERTKKARKEAEQEAADAFGKEIQDSMDAGNFQTARATLQIARRFLSGEKYEHWANTITHREGQGVPSNPEVRKAIDRELYTVAGDAASELQAAQRVLAKIDDAYSRNLLDDKDHTRQASHAQSRITRAQDQRLAAVGREHNQAEQLLKEWTRVPAGLGSMFLSDQAQTLLTAGLEDLTRNSSYMGQGDEPPLAWAARRKTFYVAQLDTIANQRKQDITRALRAHQTPQALQAARSSFSTEADYYDAVRMMKERSEIERWQRELKGGAPTAPTTTAAPTPPTAPATPTSARGVPSAPNPLGR
jgi:hypothetical protein